MDSSQSKSIYLTNSTPFSKMELFVLENGVDLFVCHDPVRKGCNQAVLAEDSRPFRVAAWPRILA